MFYARYCTLDQNQSNLATATDLHGECQKPSQAQETHKIFSFILGESLAASPLLGNYFLFVLTDFLVFVSVYIPYTHLPAFVKVTRKILKIVPWPN